MKFVFALLISFQSYALTYEATSATSEGYEVGEKEVVLQAIWESISAKLKDPKKYQDYLSLGGEKVTEVTKEVKVEKTMSKGEQIIAAQKAKNRALLGNKKKLSGKEKIQAMLAKNKAKVAAYQKEKQEKVENKGAGYEDNLRNWANKSDKFVKGSSEKVDKAIKSWKDKYEKTLKKWNEAREKYLGRVDEYKKATFEIPIENQKKVETKLIKKKITTKIPKTYHIVPGILELPVRDQGRRATCSAFAGVRSIEGVLAQNGKKRNLSEQYFYWASKPDCQSSPCRIRGSWVGYGLDSAKENPIPEEGDCPYKSVTKLANETYTPLNSSCKRGDVYIDDYKLVQSLDEVLAELDQNRSVVASLKLKENFYQNKGRVFNTDKIG
jgi:hypothetical protein